MTEPKLNLKWIALEFKHHKKNFLWYIVFSLVTLGLIGYAIYIQNWLTLTTFVCLAIVTLVFANQRPQMIEHELSSTEIRVGQTLYPYRIIKKFWIIYTKDNKSLNFETTAYLNNVVTLQLGRENPLEIKNYLKPYLQEDLDREESFTDIISRKIKF